MNIFLLITPIVMLIVTVTLSIRLAKLLSQDISTLIFIRNLIIIVICMIGFVLSLYFALNSTSNPTPYIWLKISAIFFISLLFGFYTSYFYKYDQIKHKNRKNKIIKISVFTLGIISTIIIMVTEFILLP